jgi:hypothetical protein
VQTSSAIFDGAKTEETGFKRFVSSKVKQQFHETAALTPDNKRAECLQGAPSN